MSAVKELVSQYEATKSEFTEKLKAQIAPLFAAFFKANPEFRSIEWTQYTPYFNDGESCDFRVNDVYYTAQPDLYEDDATAEDIRNGSYDFYDLEDLNIFWAPSAKERGYEWRRADVAEFDALPDDIRERRQRLSDAFEALTTDLRTIPDEIFLAAFKDHSRITVTASGVTIDEYSHD